MLEPRRRARMRLGTGLLLAGIVGVAVGMAVDHQSPSARAEADAASRLAARAAAPGSAVTLSPTTLRARGPRPNIVTVMADDMRVDDLRYMPAVRRLVAGTGLSFRNSFSPDPLCCPARASFLTGVYSHNHGVLSHEVPWGFQAFDDHASIATALRRSGYKTAFVGKYLNGYGAQRSKVTGGPSFRYVPAGWTDWYGAVERPVGSSYPSGGTYDYFHTIFNVNGRIDDTHAGEYQTDVLGRFARGLVTGYSRGRAPFFLYLSSVAPHHGAPFESDDPMGIPSTNGGTVDLVTPARPTWVKGRFDTVIRRAPGLPADGGPAEDSVADKSLPVRGAAEPGVAERAGMAEAARQRAEALYVLDRQVARLVGTLKRTGEWRNTVFMFTSDNGYFLGEHRIRQGKIKAYEPSLRVPFVVTGPGIPRGIRFDPVTTVDLTATIADLARLRRLPYPPDGRSIVPSLRADRGWTVPIVTEGHEGNRVFPKRPAAKAPGFHDGRTTIGIRTPRFKLVRFSTGAVELYDLDSDPNELRNVAGRPRYAEVQATLEQMWWDYRDCAGATCRHPLPPFLQRSPAQNQVATNRQSRGVQDRYGYWR